MKRFQIAWGSVLAVVAVTAAAPPSHAMLSWPQCRALKPGANYRQAASQLQGQGRKAGFNLVDDLPVQTYAFRRAAQTCTVQFQDGIVLARPLLR